MNSVPHWYVISQFPKTYGCSKNRFHNKAVLRTKYWLLDNLSSQSKERCSTEAQNSVGLTEHTLTYDFTSGLRSVVMSIFQIKSNLGEIIGLPLLLMSVVNKILTSGSYSTELYPLDLHSIPAWPNLFHHASLMSLVWKVHNYIVFIAPELSLFQFRAHLLP